MNKVLLPGELFVICSEAVPVWRMNPWDRRAEQNQEPTRWVYCDAIGVVIADFNDSSMPVYYEEYVFVFIADKVGWVYNKSLKVVKADGAPT